MNAGDLHCGDQSTDPTIVFASCRKHVVQEWASRVRATIAVAAQLPDPVLIDTVPEIYEHIAAVLKAEETSSFDLENFRCCAVHGRERATATLFNPDDVVQELQILRSVIFSALGASGAALSQRQHEIIGQAIEVATREAVLGFLSIDREIQEQIISSFSHDVRNPLNVASALAQLIARRPGDPNIGTLAARIVQQINAADAMIAALNARMAAGRTVLADVIEER